MTEPPAEPPALSGATASADALAHRLARATGELLMDLRRSGALAGRALGEAGDEIANVFLERSLAARRPGEAVLSEESPDDRSRLGRKAVWIVDPLDGTREYGEGREDFAVHVALSVDGEARTGAVALPAIGLICSTWQPERPARPLRDRRLIVVSRTRPPRFAQRLAALIDAELEQMGSMGAKAMAVVRGDADAYVHSGGHHEWDAAAPAAVAGHFGLHVSHLDGTPLRFNRPDTRQGDLLVCHPELAPTILAALSTLTFDEHR
jgi:3'(2'), 5'-bisphosphate nucleotidase